MDASFFRLLVLAVLCCTSGAFAVETHLVFPIAEYPDAGQAIEHKVFELNQTAPRQIVWGLFGRFAGIDPMVKSDPQKFGISLQFVFDDGTCEWTSGGKRTFTQKNSAWQCLSGMYKPPRPVKKAVFFYRLATKGEAWYDGVTLFDIPDEPDREKCRIFEKDGIYTLENGYLSFSVNPKEGATGVRLVDRRTGTGYADQMFDRRLLVDRFRGGGDCYRREWAVSVVKDADDEVALEVKIAAPGNYRYLDMSRTMKLRRDSSALDVNYVWRNQPASMGDVVIEPWIVNGLTAMGGTHQQVMYPTAKGVRRVGPQGGSLKHRDVIGGWYAAGAKDRNTMAMTFDWSNYAETWHYLAGENNLMSDIILQPISIPAGDSYATGYSFCPLAGVKNPDWVENGLAAEIVPENGKLTLKLDSAESGVFNVDFYGVCKNGMEKHFRTTVFVSPDKTAIFSGVLPACGIEIATVKLYSQGNLVFEADRAFADNYTYKPKKAKAKPADVRPFRLELKRDLVTPHTAFARPWAGGKPRVLFLISTLQAREIVELMQRADIEARTVRLGMNEAWTTWAMNERFGNYTYFDMNRSLKKELERKFDVIVVSGDRIDPVDKDNRALIDGQLAAGAGMVRIGMKKTKVAGCKSAEDWIGGNISPELLVGCSNCVRAVDAGTHREVELNYDAKLGLTPFTGYRRQDKPPFRYQDYSLGLVARAIFWAAKMDAVVTADAKRSESLVPAGPGLEIRHTFWRNSKGVCDWKAELIRVPKRERITLFSLDREDYRIGEKVEGTVGCSGGVADIELVDGFGRLMAVAKNARGRFSLVIPEARTGLLTVRVLVRKDGILADVAEKDVFCRIPYHRLEYPLCVSEDWVNTSFQEKEYLLQYRAKIYHDLGINFVRFWESDRTDAYTHMLRHGFDMNFLVYEGRAPFTWGTAFNDSYLVPYSKTHDKKYLVRTPCLHDPEYRKQIDEKTAQKIKRVARYSPITCDCGDENSLTKWTTPYDFCFSEYTLKAFRIWLRKVYGTLGRLNASWRTDYADWESVVPDTTIEARERAKRTGEKSYASWADHRRFMELSYCETLERVGKIMAKELPGVPLDISGVQFPNGWTGIDVWLLSKFVGEPAAYVNSSIMGEYIRSFGRPLIKPWTGYDVTPRTLKTWPWMVGFRFLNAGMSYWAGPNMLLPDYTPTASAIAYGKAGDEMKTGAARLLRSLEYRYEVLVHYSYGSIHASRIEERADAFDQCSQKWRQNLEARGIPYRFVSYEEIEDGELERTTAKTLVLPQSAAISDKEAAAIRRFAAMPGNKVVGDDFTGLMDEHCSRRKKPVLTDVICKDLKLGSVCMDGISVYSLYGRNDAKGRYWGLVRDEHAGNDTAVRKIRMDSPAYVYDLRTKNSLGRISDFSVSMESAEAKFFAALPYETGDISLSVCDEGMEVSISVKVGVPASAKDCHPVLLEVYDPVGMRSRLYSGVCDAMGGVGKYSFRMALNDTPGKWRIVATDYITGKKATASFDCLN